MDYKTDDDSLDVFLRLPHSLDQAKVIGDEIQRKIPGWNDMGDARRHAEWSARMQAELGTLPAVVAGYGHEFDGAWKFLRNGRLPPFQEHLMDLHNNAEGRRAAREGRPIDPAKLTVLGPSGEY